MTTKEYDFSAFFAGVAPPTDASRRRSAAYMEHYAALPDLDTFYIIYDVRPPIHIKWHCNVDRVMGYTNIRYEDIVFNVHPEWQAIFLEITTAAYQVAAMHYKDFSEADFSYHLNLPIRHQDGHFVWLRHYTVPLELDKRGEMAAHFSLYRFVEEYSGYLQMRPMVKSGKRRRYDLENKILGLARTNFAGLFLNDLRDAEKSLLVDYCQMIKQQKRNAKNLPTAQEIAAFSGRPLSTIRTYNHRIMDTVKPQFPLKDFSSVAELAYLLEWTFDTQNA